MSAVSDLQHTINRFFGTAFGAPIAEDGVVGPETLSALKQSLDYMVSSGWTDASDLESQLGNDANQVTQRASDINAMLSTFADEQGLVYAYAASALPSSGGGGGSSRPRMLPTAPKMPGSASSAGTSIISAFNALPTWVKIGGGVLAALIAWHFAKKFGGGGHARA